MDRSPYHRLLRIGNSILQQIPLQSDDRPESDERYQFAAACVELAQADGNPSFITRLPLVFDASCSGLQHLSTMMRSEEGRYANLTPSDTPTDFYQIIADQIVALLDDIPGIHHRAIVKRPVMTFFYGSTISGMTEQVLGASKDRRIKTDWRKARKIATAICEAIEATITSAKEVRTFLEKIAGAYADANKPMRWNTPLGLPILNPDDEQIIEDISYRIGGKRKRVTWCTGNTDDIRRRKSIQSVAANFIHSRDARSHNVALATKANGIELVTIYDCFGTIAPQARRLNEILREQRNRNPRIRLASGSPCDGSAGTDRRRASSAAPEGHCGPTTGFKIVFCIQLKEETIPDDEPTTSAPHDGRGDISTACCSMSSVEIRRSPRNRQR